MSTPVWEDLQNTVQMCKQLKEGRTIIIDVVLFLPPAPCPGEMLCFVVKEKVLCLGFQKRTQLEISGYVVLQHCSRTVQPNIRLCAAHFMEDYFLYLRVVCQLCTNGCFYKVGQFQLCKDSLALLTHSLQVRVLI